MNDEYRVGSQVLQDVYVVVHVERGERFEINGYPLRGHQKIVPYRFEEVVHRSLALLFDSLQIAEEDVFDAEPILSEDVGKEGNFLQEEVVGRRVIDHYHRVVIRRDEIENSSQKNHRRKQKRSEKRLQFNPPPFRRNSKPFRRLGRDPLSRIPLPSPPRRNTRCSP